jgi:diguanylate cyclase (GGDEF)-like protein
MSDDKTVTTPHRSLLVAGAARRASLIVVAGPELGHLFHLEQPLITLGRGSDADVRLDDPGISRHHAKLVRTDNVFTLIDLGSKNGVWCNGELLNGSRALKSGDKIQIGSKVVLRFDLQDELDEAAIRALYDASVRDGPTGAFNKKFFTETLRKEFAYCARHDQLLSVVMMDIDHFKQINDTHGHAIGDLVLVKLVEMFHSAIRVEDVMARVGGEEFGLLLREIDADVAIAVAERLRRRTEALKIDARGASVKVTLSAGVATFVHGAFASADEFVASADEYLYRAKNSGRNRVQSRWLSDR